MLALCLQCNGMRELSSNEGGVTSAGEAFNRNSTAQPITRVYVFLLAPHQRLNSLSRQSQQAW